MIVISSNEKQVRLGAAPMDWSVKNPAATQDVVPPGVTRPVVQQTPPAIEPPKQVVQPAQQPTPSVPTPATKPAPQTLDEFADRYVELTRSMNEQPDRRNEIDREREIVSEKIMGSPITYDNRPMTVKEYLQEAAHNIKKYKRIEVEPFELLLRALMVHGSPRRNQSLNFTNRLFGVVRYMGTEKADEWSRAKSKTKNILDVKRKEFVIPDWIADKYTAKDPAEASANAMKAAVESFAWNKFEYGGSMLPQGIDKNNPVSMAAGAPAPFQIGESPESRVKKGFDEFNRTTDLLMQAKGWPQTISAGLPKVRYNQGKIGHGDVVTARFKCPSCGGNNTSPEHMIGQWTHCKNCGNKIQVKDAKIEGRYPNMYRKMVGDEGANFLCGIKHKGWSLCNRSPWDIRKYLLDSAIAENSKDGGATEKTLSQTTGQPVTLDPKRWGEGGDLWVHESMVNPGRRAISPGSLKAALDRIRSGRDVSLQTKIEGDDRDIDMQDMMDEKYVDRKHKDYEASSDRTTRLASLKPSLASAILGFLEGDEGIPNDISSAIADGLASDVCILAAEQASGLTEILGEEMGSQIRLAKFVLIAKLGAA